MQGTEAQLLEERRLEKLYSYGILDTEDEAAFNRIAEDLSLILRIPTVFISFMDRKRQWFKACVQLDARETPRQVAFCAYTIQQSEPLVVEDATTHELFKDNPLVTGSPFIRAYLGVPLVSEDGYRIGTICALDYQKRTFSQWDREVLKGFALRVMDELRQRLLRKEYGQVMGELQAIMHASPSGFVLLDGDKQVLGANPAAERITGMKWEPGMVFHGDLFLPDPRVPGRERVYNRWMGSGWFTVTETPLPSGRGLLVLEDVTDHVQNQLYLSDIAFRDSLTGVGNRQAFEVQLGSFTPQGDVAVAFIDLDGFKEVNDTHGHAAGDRVLQEVARRLQAVVRAEDRVYRMGGDEVTVVLFGDVQKETLEALASRMLSSIQEPIPFEDKTLQVGASIGLTVRQQGEAMPDLLARADQLMYRVKHQGKNRCLLE